MGSRWSKRRETFLFLLQLALIFWLAFHDQSRSFLEHTMAAQHDHIYNQRLQGFHNVKITVWDIVVYISTDRENNEQIKLQCKIMVGSSPNLNIVYLNVTYSNNLGDPNTVYKYIWDVKQSDGNLWFNSLKVKLFTIQSLYSRSWLISGLLKQAKVV